jgi:hypothetical protein
MKEAASWLSLAVMSNGQTHIFVAVDEAARVLGHKTFPATTAGHQAAIRWAAERFGAALRWAVEDCQAPVGPARAGPAGRRSGRGPGAAEDDGRGLRDADRTADEGACRTGTCAKVDSWSSSSCLRMA